MINFLRGFSFLILVVAVVLSISYGLGILLNLYFEFDHRFLILLTGWVSLLSIGLAVALVGACYELGKILK